MKLRLRSNSVRLRLTRSEVEQLTETGLVEETVEFAPSPLVYLLHASTENRDVRATFHGGWITISLPWDMAKTWASTEQVGIETNYNGVGILVEKDWACVHASDEDNEDTFPKP